MIKKSFINMAIIEYEWIKLDEEKLIGYLPALPSSSIHPINILTPFS